MNKKCKLRNHTRPGPTRQTPTVNIILQIVLYPIAPTYYTLVSIGLRFVYSRSSVTVCSTLEYGVRIGDSESVHLRPVSCWYCVPIVRTRYRQKHASDVPDGSHGDSRKAYIGRRHVRCGLVSSTAGTEGDVNFIAAMFTGCVCRRRRPRTWSAPTASSQGSSWRCLTSSENKWYVWTMRFDC